MDKSGLVSAVGITGATSLTVRMVEAEAAAGVKDFVDVLADAARIFGTLGGVIVVTVVLVLALAILPYAIYITFFPLIRTLGGGVDALKTHSAEKRKARAAKKEQR